MSEMKMGAMLGPVRRYIPTMDAEVRHRSPGALEFTGHAAVFGSRTWIGPPKYGFWEELVPGAFAKTISESDVRQLMNHDPNYPLARSTVTQGPGSLRLSEDSTGLVTDAEWIPTSYARDLHIAIDAKVVTGQSFGFQPTREDWTTDEAGLDVRTLIEVKLFDAGPVTFPAYEETDAALRAIDDELDAAVEVPLEQRKQFVRAFFGRVPTSDLALSLRAALHAPAERGDERHAPAETTRALEDALAASDANVRLRYRALAAMSADWTKGRPLAG